jgi:hypothetical protein
MTRIADTRAMSHGFLLDGQWLSEGEALEVRSPFDHDLVGTTFRPQTAHIEMAIQAAVRAFEVARKLSSYERQRVLQSAEARETARFSSPQSLPAPGPNNASIARKSSRRSSPLSRTTILRRPCDG